MPLDTGRWELAIRILRCGGVLVLNHGRGVKGELSQTEVDSAFARPGLACWGPTTH